MNSRRAIIDSPTPTAPTTTLTTDVVVSAGDEGAALGRSATRITTSVGTTAAASSSAVMGHSRLKVVDQKDV